jgi:spore coat polysaccharide biosynthesis predicted glycosyltransferase SpsG
LTRSVTVVADAGPEAGLGHLSRCTGLAVALGCHGCEVRTLAYGADEPLTLSGVEWEPTPLSGDPTSEGAGPVVLDSYRLSGSGAPAGGELVAFHDQGQPGPPPGARVVALAGSEGAWAAGPRYACLRPEFWGLEPVAPAAAVGRVLVAAGSGVSGGAGAAAAAVLAAVPGAEVRLVVGPYAGDGVSDGVVAVRAPGGLRDELRAADLVVTAAGQTMLEALCAGVPCVAYAAVENQRAQLELMASGAAVQASDPGSLGAAVAALAQDHARRGALAARARETVDGFGALRLAARIAA